MPDANMRKTFEGIEILVGGHFDYAFSNDCPDVAISSPGRRIWVNSNLWLKSDGYGRLFWLLHEMGHHQLGHLSKAGQVIGFTQPWIRPEMELSADGYAINKMLDSGLKPEKLLGMAVNLFRGNPGDATHPTGAVRVQNIAKVIQLRKNLALQKEAEAENVAVNQVVRDDNIERFIKDGKQDFPILKGKIEDRDNNTYHTSARPFGGKNSTITIDDDEISPTNEISTEFYDGLSLADASKVYSALIQRMDGELKGWTPDTTRDRRDDKARFYTSKEHHQVMISLGKKKPGPGYYVNWYLDIKKK